MNFIKQYPVAAIVIAVLLGVALISGLLERLAVELAAAGSDLVFATVSRSAGAIVLVIAVMLLFGLKPWKRK